MTVKLEIGNYSDVGKVREVNEDYFGSTKGEFGHVIVVCDGMGGHKGGEMASRISVETILNHFKGLPNEYNPKYELRKSILTANEVVQKKARDNVELKDMGSTAVVLLITNDKAYTAHIGDSRIYLIRNKQIYQITKDQSLVQKMVDSNIITADAAKTHPKKNVITHSIGNNGESEPEVSDPIFLFKKDVFILCSDGLTNYVESNELLGISLTNSVQITSEKLVELANDRGGNDNITVQGIEVIKGKSLPLKTRHPNSKKYITMVFGFLLISIAMYFLTSLLSNDEISRNYYSINYAIIDSCEIFDSLKIDDLKVIEGDKVYFGDTIAVIRGYFNLDSIIQVENNALIFNPDSGMIIKIYYQDGQIINKVKNYIKIADIDTSIQTSNISDESLLENEDETLFLDSKNSQDSNNIEISNDNFDASMPYSLNELRVKEKVDFADEIKIMKIFTDNGKETNVNGALFEIRNNGKNYIVYPKYKAIVDTIFVEVGDIIGIEKNVIKLTPIMDK